MIIVHAHATLEITHSIEFTLSRQNVLRRIQKIYSTHTRTLWQLTESKIGKFQQKKHFFFLSADFTTSVLRIESHEQSLERTHSLYSKIELVFLFWVTKCLKTEYSSFYSFVRSNARTNANFSMWNKLRCNLQITNNGTELSEIINRLYKNCPLSSTHNSHIDLSPEHDDLSSKYS